MVLPNMSLTPNRTDITDFMIRGTHKVEPQDYAACKAADSKGIELVEKTLGKALLTYRNWREIFDGLDALSTDAMLLRLQYVYSIYMLAKITRALKGNMSSEDQILTGYRYYQDQLEARRKLLEQWINTHPEDKHLMPDPHISG
jgi:hypothetical protein